MRGWLVLLLAARSAGWSGEECASRWDNEPVVYERDIEAWVGVGAAMFRACGVVAVVPADPGTTAAVALRRELAKEAAPLLERRASLRDKLMRAMVDRRSLRALGAEEVDDEQSLLWAGEAYRERNDGRIDLAMSRNTSRSLPFRAARLVRELLGADATLRAARVVLALGGVAANQHWHRDSTPIFDDVPVYALNAFVYVEDLRYRGATEFVLGSHRWPAAKWPEDARDVEKAFALDAGAVVIADYRTVHRGPAMPRAGDDRYLAMFVYGLSWWRDAVNYETGDYGGARTPADVDHDSVTLVAEIDPDEERLQCRWRMFWGLVNRWEAGLVAELDRRVASRRWKAQVVPRSDL
ncbi:hypothetical protein CTAYLR_005055 [Chrysophaeum taylorii]|uniref:Uncharacterized protein n=1 Tax=Chrysophaeum taylorii TaxID=2483200 RepID=A0AAD7U9S7_9STRA|nr:hypothetical protein CTAYLR_005055 [Chrysophaeum taylorii]